MNPTQFAAGLRGALASQYAGLNVSWQTGTVAAVGAHGANTVDVYLDNSAAGAGASVTPSLPYLSDYNPAVGDAVLILAGQAGLRTARVVIGTLAGASSGAGASGVPVGTILMFPVTVAYPNFLLCNGGTFSATTYPLLNTLLGGNTLPNLQGVAPMGAGANGVVLGTQDANGHVLAHTHTSAAHSHTDSGHGHNHHHVPSTGASFVNGGASGVLAGTGSSIWGSSASTQADSTSSTANITSTTPGATGSTGSGTANVPPNLGVAFFIRAA